MKGAGTLAVYVAVCLIPVVFGPAATGQGRKAVTTTQETSTPPGTRIFPSPLDGWTPPDRRHVNLLPSQQSPEPVVLYREPGGSVPLHEQRFRGLAHTGAPVELRGPCMSACTIITGLVPKERLCFARTAYLAFHASVSNIETRFYSAEGTKQTYSYYPPEIKAWIDARGGWQKLTVDEFWQLPAHELWAMGYAKCQ